MVIRSSKNIIPLVYPIPFSFLKRYFLFIPLLFFYLASQAQEISPAFKETTASLLKKAPETYEEINAVLKPNRRDTILLNYFIAEALKKQYYSGLAYAYNQKGTKYRNISEYSKAIQYHLEGLNAAKDGNNIEFQIFSLNMVSVVYRRIDAVKTALDYNQEALELADNIENPSAGIKRSINVSLNSIGNIYASLEQYELAINHFTRSLEYEKELDNKIGQAINNQNIGECLEHLGKLDEALEHYKIALSFDIEADSERGKLICNNSIAQIYNKQGKPQKALDIIKSILPASQEFQDKHITTTILITTGKTFFQLGKYKEALIHIEESIELSKEYGFNKNVAEGYTVLSEVYKKQKDYKKALEYYQQGEEYFKKVTNEVNLKYVNDIILRYDTKKKSSQIEELAKDKEKAEEQLRKNNTTLLVSGLGLLLLAGILYILYRQYQLNHEKRVLTLEQSMLRSQMNPHFLFNSLNSIKLYIINNEKKNAVHYLNKFSKLVRKILEASSLKEISLADELETVELYMNIENIRFSNEIQFKIEIEEDIDVHTVKTPSLILQPFLENAIWHGLSSKEGEKNIVIAISRKNEWFINITITDNGVGRARAQKIKDNKVLKRKSVGIDITKERLANFSKDYQNSFEVEFVDLYDDNGHAAGTQVILNIPTV